METIEKGKHMDREWMKKISEILRTENHSRNARVNDLMDRWQKRVAKIIFHCIFLVFLGEVVFGWYLWKTDALLVPLPQHIWLYIARPTLINFGVFGVWMFLFRKLKSYYVKALLSIITLTVTLSTIIVIHYIYPPVYSALLIPMFVSLIYEDKKITRSTLTVVMIAFVIDMTLIYQTVPADLLPVRFGENVLMAFMELIIAFSFANVSAGFEVAKRQMESEEYQSNLALQMKLKEDRLTQVLNYAGYRMVLDHEVESYDGSQSLIMSIIDIDHFKNVNDDYGHEKGNDVLRRLGAILRGVQNEEITCARYGGEEFAVIFKGKSMKEAEAVMEKIRNDFKAESYEGIERTITLSAGIAEYRKGCSSTEFFEEADAALYKAKNGGRNRVVAVYA